jgi:hypothetical protein
MHAGHYRDLIVKAVMDENDELLDSIAAHLAACEQAKQILCAKGYGGAGLPIDGAARLVPPLPKCSPR